jgi:aspartate/methionine/tyrosine aminotransferase
LAYFFAKRFLFPDSPSLTPAEALQHVSPNNVAIGAGGAALLNYLFFALGEKGDVCLIPAPYYAAFENDMSCIAGCQPYAVHMTNPSQGPTVEDLELAYKSAKAKGLSVKFLLLTNPNNPFGTIYKPSVIRNAVGWARKRGMQTIVDELYALSVHRSTGHGFESVIRVLDNQLGDDVYMLWALSKDFGASGFRVGAIYSQNAQFMEALGNLNVFSGVSQPIQAIIADILTDDRFIDHFLENSRERLRYSYQLCTSKLEEMVIPYIPAEAGLFVYADFSALMRKKTPEGEAMLTEMMRKYARVVLTPGESQRDLKPGNFRICYAWVQPEVLEIAMERLSRLVAKLRRMDWSDFNELTLQSIIG